MININFLTERSALITGKGQQQLKTHEKFWTETNIKVLNIFHKKIMVSRNFKFKKVYLIDNNLSYRT